MEKKKSAYKKENLWTYYLFEFGFLTGIILPNIMYKMEWQQSTVSALYMISLFAGESSKDYLFQVLKTRGIMYVLAMCSGLTIFGMPIAILGMLMMGMYIAMVLTVSILQFGFHGGLLGAALLFPQYVIYVPCLFYGFRCIYINSKAICKKKVFFSGRVAGYIFQMTICGICFFAGILLEVYCNPVITEILIKNLKIF